MKINILIALTDSGYVEHLSKVLLEKYEETFAVNVCYDRERFMSLSSKQNFDIVLFGLDFVDAINRNTSTLQLLLASDEDYAADEANSFIAIQKYQRISAMVRDILMRYAEVSSGKRAPNTGLAKLTAVWSPSGGSGKTTIALAYAAQKVAEGKKVTYLDLEPFSSTEVYFTESVGSISRAFEKLDTSNLELLLQSIRSEDKATGIHFFGRPENYDDINILSSEDIEKLIYGCGAGEDEVVIDLSASIDSRTIEVLLLADSVVAVVNSSKVSEQKWEQFTTQHNIYGQISQKTILVANRGARCEKKQAAALVRLPEVQSDDPIIVYKTLSANYFV